MVEFTIVVELCGFDSAGHNLALRSQLSTPRPPDGSEQAVEGQGQAAEGILKDSEHAAEGQGKAVIMQRYVRRKAVSHHHEGGVVVDADAHLPHTASDQIYVQHFKNSKCRKCNRTIMQQCKKCDRTRRGTAAANHNCEFHHNFESNHNSTTIVNSTTIQPQL